MSYETDLFILGLLDSLDIPAKHIVEVNIKAGVDTVPTIDVTYSMAHVPTFHKIGELTKSYTVVPTAKLHKKRG